MLRTLVILTVIVGGCGGASCAEQSASDANSVSSVLDGLRQKTSGLRSYQCEVNYLFSQPVLESKTLRTGKLYYSRLGNGSKLRINFDTLTQDENPKQKYGDQYIFDGQWLTHIDYQIKQVQKRQLADANEQIDAFELAKRNFPLIGFDKTEDLKKEFDVNQIGPASAQSLQSDSNRSGAFAVTSDSNQIVHLHMTVKPDSIYKDDYKSVEVWIDKGLMLPVKISAVSTQGDIYEISFIKPKANEAIDEKVFGFSIPEGFGKPEIIPLKTK